MVSNDLRMNKTKGKDGNLQSLGHQGEKEEVLVVGNGGAVKSVIEDEERKPAEDRDIEEFEEEAKPSWSKAVEKNRDSMNFLSFPETSSNTCSSTSLSSETTSSSGESCAVTFSSGSRGSLASTAGPSLEVSSTATETLGLRVSSESSSSESWRDFFYHQPRIWQIAWYVSYSNAS